MHRVWEFLAFAARKHFALGILSAGFLLVPSAWAEAPSVSSQPADQILPLGATVTLSVGISGTQPVALQWFKDGRMLEQGTNSVLSITNADLRATGLYYAAATNAEGVCISLSARVMVGNPQLLGWGEDASNELGGANSQTMHGPESAATNVVAMAAGANHSHYVMSDGSLWAVGRNGVGQLGDGSTTDRAQPILVTNGVMAVSAGQRHSLFVRTNGVLYGMGVNGSYQLGDGTTTSRTMPVPVASNVVAVCGGRVYSLFLKGDGTLWGMGENTYGNLGNGKTTNQPTPMALASNVVSVAAGATHSLFLKADGSLWGMGQNNYGQLGLGSTGDQVVPRAAAVSAHLTVLLTSPAH